MVQTSDCLASETKLTNQSSKHISTMTDSAESEVLQQQDEIELDEFQAEIQQVTNFVKDHDEKEEEIETNDLSPANMDSNHAPYSSINTYTPSMTSTELSVSYSHISDESSYIHGAAFSSPKAAFGESAIPAVVEIHDLLTTRHHTLFFVPDSDDECSANQVKQQEPKKKMCKKKSKRSSLKKSLSERGLTFAISEGHVYFNWAAFIREYIYNFFNILILPIIWYMESKSGAQSRMYWPCDWRLYGHFTFLQVLGFFYVNISYFAWFSHNSGYPLTVLVYDVLYLLRITVIAIKWGYLPPQIFDMMRKKKLTTEQFKMIHLLTGWVNHKNKTGLAREIGQCCARLELDINELKFAFRDERRQGLRSNTLCLRRRCSTYTTYGNLLIPYIVFCASRHLSKWSAVFGRMCFIISPIISLFPVIARIHEFSSFKQFKAAVMIYGLLWYLITFITNTMNLYMLMSFSAVIALDFKRRYQFVRFCTRLIELKKDAFIGMGDYKQHLFPSCNGTKEGRKMLQSAIIQTLDLSDEETMYNWSKLRAFFLDFGLRFLRREEAILGYFILSMFLVFASYIAVLYLDILEVGYWEMASITLAGCAVLTPAFTALRYATRINQKVTQQRYILADKRLRLEDERLHRITKDENENQCATSGTTIESIARASCMLDKIIKMLEVDRFRIRMLGYTVDTTVTGIIAAIIGTVGFMVARLLLGEKAEGIPDT
eukprot:640244_1